MNLQQLKTKVFEALGFASMCWIPKPSTQEFDSTLCEGKGNELMDDIHSFARSQAIGFAEWIVANDYRATVGCKNWAKWNPASSTWIYRTTAKLLTEFIEWKKQQEGKGE